MINLTRLSSEIEYSQDFFTFLKNLQKRIEMIPNSPNSRTHFKNGLLEPSIAINPLLKVEDYARGDRTQKWKVVKNSERRWQMFGKDMNRISETNLTPFKSWNQDKFGFFFGGVLNSDNAISMLFLIGPIFLQTIPIPVQAQKNWSWIRIIFDWMILLRIFVFRDHLKENIWDSQQPIIVYEVSWLNLS